MSVSIVIPHLRGHEQLLAVLGDLERERAQHPNLEVLVVDNASTDGSVQAAKETYPWVRVLHLAENLGFAGGCNAGILAVQRSAEWIWLLNDDVRIVDGVVAKMIEAASEAEDIAAVQPKILNLVRMERFDYAGGAGGLIDRFGYPFALGRIGGYLERDEGQYDSPREIFWASGTACFWRRKALDEVGLLDEGFFAHMEEIDLSWRAWNAGWRIVSAPSGVVRHLGGGTLSYKAWRKMFLNHRNGLITVAKNRQKRMLAWLLPLRLVLDNCIGVAEFFTGRPGRLLAVWAGWIGFLLRTPSWLISRRQAQAIRKRKDAEVEQRMYNGSVLFRYLAGVRSAANLKGV